MHNLHSMSLFRVQKRPPIYPVTPLVAEVRSRLTQVASHPSTIDVRAQDGVVTLSGPVFDHEVNSLLDAVRKVEGVTGVHHHFDIMISTPSVKARHQRENQFGYRPEFIVGRWAPWLRIVLGSSGLLLLAQGIWKDRRLGSASSLAGIGLLTRSITNRDITHLIGSFILPVLRMRRSLRIAAPIDDVFEFWRHFENYPKFMSFIRSVEVNETGGLRWVAVAPGRTRILWDTTIFDLQPNQRIAWKSDPGSVIATEGIIQMEPTEFRGTLLRVELSYAPPFGAVGYAVAHLLGFDPRRKIDEDLEVMKLLIEKSARESSTTSFQEEATDFHRARG